MSKPVSVMRLILCVLLTLPLPVVSQDAGFTFGQISFSELEMKSYAADTIASAVVLAEFGQAYIENSDQHDLIYEYHAKIKILKRTGFEKANFAIPLVKTKLSRERWISLEAATYNLQDYSIKKMVLDPAAVFIEKAAASHDVVRFTLPDIQVGSVIEVKYVLSSPFYYNFRTWNFQDDIPKIRSEYWATIPANYDYNIGLMGYLKLTRTQDDVVKSCFSTSGGIAECTRHKYIMENIPAFYDEEFMTARKNYLSSVNFELSKVTAFNGVVTKYAQEWRDVDNDLLADENFGKQIRKARSLDLPELKRSLEGEGNELRKATLIYDYVKHSIVWNGNLGKYSELEVRKAFEVKKGNVGDINLGLIGLLQENGLDAEPVLLSTRNNGVAAEIYPVVTDFNYVIARLKIANVSYLLDATDDFLPFGMIPLRCVNGRGRIISKDGSDWLPLAAGEKKKKLTRLALKLMENGRMEGTLSIQSLGYEALARRKKLADAQNENEFIGSQDKHTAVISNYRVENATDLSKILTETMDISIDASDDMDATIFLNPFFSDRIVNNPFKSATRFFPVDLGSPEETVFTLTMEVPKTMKVEEIPAPKVLQLPDGGGRFLVNSNIIDNVVNVTSSLSLNRAIYTPMEYHALKELYARIIQIHQSQIVLKRK